MENEVLIAAFLGTGLLACVIIPASSSWGTGCSTTWQGTEKKIGAGENFPLLIFYFVPEGILRGVRNFSFYHNPNGIPDYIGYDDTAGKGPPKPCGKKVPRENHTIFRKEEERPV